MEYDNEKSGALFANKDKKEDWHRDMQGSITVEGVEYYMDGYKKVSNQGVPFISIKLKPKVATAKKQLPISWQKTQTFQTLAFRSLYEQNKIARYGSA